MMKRKMTLLAALFAVCVVCISAVTNASVTIATFDDPSGDSSVPLFVVDTTANNGLISGGWADSQENLDLYIPYVSANYHYEDAWFTMTDLTYDGGIDGGMTSGGVINFYEDGSTVNPVLTITFTSALLQPLGTELGVNEIFFSGVSVVITGIDITDQLQNESFGFTFTNQAETDNGYTATAAFTSSATVVPEPATLALLGVGFALVRRKK